MSLRSKLLCIVGISLVSVLVITFIILYVIIIRQADIADRQEAEEGISQALYVLEDLKTRVDVLVKDYAEWTDTYDFVTTRSQKYIETNVITQTLVSLKIDMMLFLDATASPVYLKAVDRQTEEDTIAPPEAIAYLQSVSATRLSEARREKDVEIITAGSQLLLLDYEPIVRSDGSGPSNGILAVGRYIRPEDFSSLAQYGHANASVMRWHDEELDPEIKATLQQSPQQVITRTQSDGNVHAYISTGNKGTDSAVVFNVSVSRERYREAVVIVTAIAVSLALLGLIAGVVLRFTITRFIHGPIHQVQRGIETILEHNDFSKQVVYTGKDEMSAVARMVNTLLTRINSLHQNITKQSDDLATKVKEIEEKNKTLEDSKTAMLNILEDQKSLEDALRQEKDRITAMMRAVGDGLAVIDQTGAIVYLNPAAEKLLGIFSYDSVGKPWTKVVTAVQKGQNIDPGQSLPDKVLKDGLTYTIGVNDEYEYKSYSGKRLPVSVVNSPLLDPDRRITGVVIVFRDITRETHAKAIIEQAVVERTKQLREEKARLDASINSLSLGFIMVNPAGEVITMNRAVSSLLPVPRFTRLLKDFDAPLEGIIKPTEVLGRVMTSRQPFTIESIAFKNTYLRLLCAPMFIDSQTQKDLLGSVMVIEDITSNKLLERTRDEFFSIASHELRTPLTAIRGNTSMITQFFPDIMKNPDLAQMITDIHSSSVRLIEIVNDFLDVSRLEQKRFEFKKETFILADVLNHVSKEFNGICQERRLTLEVTQSEASGLSVTADQNRFKQVLLNIIGNALKYSEHGGVKVSSFVKGDKVEIVVTDTGKGIPRQMQPLLFRKFQQAGDNIITRDATRGTGLGLYISKLMAEGMGGDVYLIRSEPGVGSVFGITIPRVKG